MVWCKLMIGWGEGGIARKTSIKRNNKKIGERIHLIFPNVRPDDTLFGSHRKVKKRGMFH